MTRHFILPLFLSFASLTQAQADDKPAVRFRLTFDKSVLDKPFTGRVIVVLLKNDAKNVIRQFNWFNPEPAFAKDVKDWKPGEELVITAGDIICLPQGGVTPGRYFVQAVLDRDLGGISFGASPGNIYSKNVAIEWDPKSAEPISLTLDQVVKEPPHPVESVNVKYVDIESALLTKFHGRPVRMQAGVVLPPSFSKESERKYPVVYEIPGFSGNHLAATGVAQRRPWDVAGTEVIWVVLDPSCRLGHHVFADSANNGPCGKALVEELIPEIEKRFRCLGVPGARLLTGHSSGGWSSLWLQVTYPEVFGGCWSTSPDPVDFRDFQLIDIYAPKANAFVDTEGKQRPLARRSGKVILHFKPFSDMEEVMGRGGQLGSFEAVFSPRGPDHRPLQLWDRKTGTIDPVVAKAWEKYDIRLLLERNWKLLGPKLEGKLHVYMGEEDTFYLNGATQLLKKSLTDLKSDAVVEFFPGKTHALIDAKLRERMNAEMATALRASKKTNE
jgi:S-formylglutathione hydrolase FrmB